MHNEALIREQAQKHDSFYVYDEQIIQEHAEHLKRHFANIDFFIHSRQTISLWLWRAFLVRVLKQMQQALSRLCTPDSTDCPKSVSLFNARYNSARPDQRHDHIYEYSPMS